MDTRDDVELVLRALRASPELRQTLAKTVVEEFSRDAFSVKCHVLPGGILPERHSDGAVGFDLHARAVVDPRHMDSDDPRLRKTLFDFETVPDQKSPLPFDIAKDVVNGNERLGCRIYPGESVLVGVGVAFWMPPTLYQWITPRSGLASRLRITLGNAPGTVDSDYRGEAAVVIVNEGESPYTFYHGDRIGQMLFQPVVLPRIEVVESLDELGSTNRGANGFGSTGFRAHKE
jgi:dUTP pyrophosphatase